MKSKNVALYVYPKLYPCVTCQTANSASRPGVRCTGCGIAHKKAYSVAYWKEVARKRKTLKPFIRPTISQLLAKAGVQVPVHSDITLYRVEKLARTERGPATRESQLIYEIIEQMSETPEQMRRRKKYAAQRRAA